MKILAISESQMLSTGSDKKGSGSGASGSGGSGSGASGSGSGSEESGSGGSGGSGSKRTNPDVDTESGESVETVRTTKAPKVTTVPPGTGEGKSYLFTLLHLVLACDFICCNFLAL